MWPFTRIRSSPASRARVDVAAHCLGAWRSTGRARSAPGSRPSRTAARRSPRTPSPRARSRAGRCAPRGGRSAAPSTLTSTRTSVSGCSPIDHGHHSRGLAMSRFHATSLVPRASGWSCCATAAPSTQVVMRADRAASLSSRACRRRWARVSLASRHSTRSGRSAPGRSSSMVTGRHNPPGFHVRSNDSPSCSTPVMLRFASRSRWGQHDTSTARTCSPESLARLGDVEPVGEEVALGVAEVGAVEPHVGLVEDALEGDEHAPVVGGWFEVERTSIQQRAVRLGELGNGAPVTGDRNVGPRASRRRRARCPMRRTSSSAVHARHVPLRSMCGSVPVGVRPGPCMPGSGRGRVDP